MTRLYQFISDHYDLEELRSLCFELGVKYDDLGSDTLSGKARELILWMGRRGQLDELLSALRRTRPKLFNQAGLSTDPAALESLYAALPAWEDEVTPPRQHAEGHHIAQADRDGIAIVGDDNIVVEGDFYAAWAPWERLRQHPRILCLMLAIATVLIIVILIWADVGGARQWLYERGLLPGAFPSASEDEVLIVIAKFHVSKGIPDTEIHDVIRPAIEEAAEELGFSHLRVGVEPTRLSAYDQARAKRLGKRYKASMIIWGADTGVQVTVNYLNLKQPNFYAAEVKIRETKRTQLAEPSAYAGFVTKDLTGQLTFLAMFAVGQSYYIEGAYSDAIRVIESAVSSLVSETASLEGAAEAYFRLGWLYQVTDDDERAIFNYDQAIALNPDDDKAYYNRGRARYDQGDLDGAIADYDRAIELEPNYAPAYNNRAVARKAQGDLDGAIADYDRVIELDPDYALAYHNRGVARQALGDLEGAIADYDQASKLGNDPAPFYNGLCWAYSLNQQPEVALPYCQRAVEIDPQPGFIDSRGLAYALLGDYEAAVADFQVFVAWLNQQTGDKWQAGLARRKAWIEALEVGQNPFTPEVLEELRDEWGEVPVKDR